MSQDNQITLRGYVCGEPTLWQTKNNTTGAEVRIGSTPRWLNRDTGEWQEGEPTYYTVKCWRNLAVNIKGSLHKGDRVIVRGKFITRTWVDDKQHRRTEIEVDADSVGHDLAFVWSFVNRGTRAPRNVTESLANGELARADLGTSDGTAGPDTVRPDDLPPVPDESDAYSQDDYAMGGAGDPASGSDTPGVPDPENAASAEASTEVTAAVSS